MTNREINELTQDGGRGRNVYIKSGGNLHRVIRARSRRGVREVRLLSFDGPSAWRVVRETDTFEIH